MKVSGGRVVVGVDHLVLEVLTNSSSQNCNGSTSSLNASARRVEDSHASLRNIVRDTFAKVTLSHQLDMRQDSTRYLWAAILVLLFLLLLLCAALALAVFFPTKWSGRNPLQRLRASFFRQKKTRRLSEGWQASSPSSESDGVKESLPPIRYDLSWCSPADAPQATCLLKASIHFVERPWTSSSVTRVLHDYEVHSSKWTDTAINGMVTELNEGKARLYSIDGSLLRSVDIVRVFVVCKDDHPLVLHVSSRPPPKHSFVHFEGPREIAQPLQGRMLPDESPETCARRCLSEKLNVPSGFIEVRPEVTQVHEECEDYLPGLSNHARFYTVRADVVSKKTSHLEQIGMTKGRLSSNGYKCKWLSINDSEFQKIFQPPGRCFKASLFSTRAESILPWSEQDVRKLCAQHGITNVDEYFGKSVADLALLLRIGKLAIGLNKSTGHLVCVEELVILRVRSADDWTLTHLDRASRTVSFPSTRKRSNEGTWMTAFRLSREHLRLSELRFQISSTVADMVEYEDAPIEEDNIFPSGQPAGCLRRAFILNGRLSADIADVTLSYAGIDVR